MNEKEQKEAEGKETQESQAQPTKPGAVDTPNRVPANVDKEAQPANQPNQPEQPNMIAQANFAAERLEKANAESKKQNDRSEKLAADAIASGRGQMVPTQAPITEEKRASRRRIKAVADASGASWGKNYE